MCRFAAFLGASVLAFVVRPGPRRAHGPALAAAVLGSVLFVAAGEEISWGQRWFGTETPALLVDGNRAGPIACIDGLQRRRSSPSLPSPVAE